MPPVRYLETLLMDAYHCDPVRLQEVLEQVPLSVVLEHLECKRTARRLQAKAASVGLSLGAL